MQQISISIVSHLQCSLVEKLLADIEGCCKASSIEVILTINMEEALPFAADSFSFQIKVIRNPTPKGFAANQNQAFAHATGEFFCVMNPDIRLNHNPFPELLACLQNLSVGVVSPVVMSKSGQMEDSARRFPTPLKILCKAFGGCKGSDYAVNDEVIFPDWVAGMFMLFRREVFKELSGFDERYFLYYEDVELCARLRLLGYSVAVCSDAEVVHDARRESHRSFKYMKWHLTSMLRFFLSPAFLKVCRLRLTGKHPRSIEHHGK